MYGWEVPWSWYQQLMSRFLRLRNLCSFGGTWMCITHSMRISHPLSNVITHLQVGYTAVIYILRKSNMAMENPLQLNLARKINEHHLYMFFSSKPQLITGGYGLWTTYLAGRCTHNYVSMQGLKLGIIGVYCICIYIWIHPLSPYVPSKMPSFTWKTLAKLAGQVD